MGASPSREVAAPSLLLLGIASSLSPFGMAVVVPTLGDVTRVYGVDYAAAQFLISAYLFGLGTAQPASGFLCDRYGRRPVMLYGFGLFTAASIAALFAPDLPTLVALRFLQAIGVSVGTVASRAIVRDTHDAVGAASAMGVIAAAMGAAPVVAPILGGFVGAEWGPAGVFALSAAVGLAVWLWMFRALAETRPPGVAADPGAGDWRGNYRELLTAGPFMGYTLMYGFVQGSFFAFLAVGAAVFETHLGLGPRTFGGMWALMALTYIGGAFWGTRLTARRGIGPALWAGLVATAVLGFGAPLAPLAAGINVVSVMLPLVLLTGASGIVSPLAMAGVVNYRPDIAGTSSGLSSALGLVIAGAFSILSGAIYDGDYLPIAWLVTAGSLLTAATWFLVRGTLGSGAGDAARQ